jgi:hypothetical protein
MNAHAVGDKKKRIGANSNQRLRKWAANLCLLMNA